MLSPGGSIKRNHSLHFFSGCPPNISMSRPMSSVFTVLHLVVGFHPDENQNLTINPPSLRIRGNQSNCYYLALPSWSVVIEKKKMLPFFRCFKNLCNNLMLKTFHKFHYLNLNSSPHCNPKQWAQQVSLFWNRGAFSIKLFLNQIYWPSTENLWAHQLLWWFSLWR